MYSENLYEHYLDYKVNYEKYLTYFCKFENEMRNNQTGFYRVKEYIIAEYKSEEFLKIINRSSYYRQAAEKFDQVVDGETLPEYEILEMIIPVNEEIIQDVKFLDNINKFYKSFFEEDREMNAEHLQNEKI